MKQVGKSVGCSSGVESSWLAEMLAGVFGGPAGWSQSTGLCSQQRLGVLVCVAHPEQAVRAAYGQLPPAS